jgi:hypothetical protein
MTAQRRLRMTPVRKFTSEVPREDPPEGHQQEGPPDDQEPPPVGDVRVIERLAHKALDDELAAKIRHGLNRARVRLDEDTVRQAADEFGRARTAFFNARDNFLEIGRALNRAEGLVGQGGFKGLVKQGILPFSAASASRFRTVAKAVDEGRIPQELLPGGIGAAYAICSCSPDEISALQEQGYIRPDVKYEDVTGFIAALRAPEPDDGTNREGDEPAPLPKAERKRLETQLRKAERQQRDLDAQIARLKRLLG